MIKKLIVLITLTLFISLPAYAVNDVDDDHGNIITITTIDGTDWTWTDSRADAVNGLYVWCIFFHPGATDDTVTFKLVDANGPEILYFKGADTYDQRIWYAPPKVQYKLFYDATDLNDNALIIIHLR